MPPSRVPAERPGRKGARPCAALLACAFTVLLGACARRPTAPVHPDWVLHARLDFVDDQLAPRPAPARATWRLSFNWIAGDLYGSPTTGDLERPAYGAQGSLTIDLNRSNADLLRELVPTDFGLSYLRIEPAAARLARLAPLALQADGIEPIARPEWVNEDTREPLMLVYIDRPAHILGGFSRGGYEVRYDVRAVRAGYLWIACHGLPDGLQLYTETPTPRHLLLALRPLAAPR